MSEKKFEEMTPEQRERIMALHAEQFAEIINRMRRWHASHKGVSYTLGRDEVAILITGIEVFRTVAHAKGLDQIPGETKQ